MCKQKNNEFGIWDNESMEFNCYCNTHNREEIRKKQRNLKRQRANKCPLCNKYTEFVSDDNSDCVCTMCGRKIESEDK